MRDTKKPTSVSDDLRSMIFNLNPNEIGISKDTYDHPVWGVVLETGYPVGFFTLVSLAEGTTSLYFSNGGGILGGGEHDNVREAADRYLSGAQQFFEKATRVDEYPPPADGEVTFYFLTFEGVRKYSAPEEKFGSKKDDLSNLFLAAHAVISELRQLEQK